MATISKELNEEIAKNPGKDYSVLITLKDEVKDEELPPDLENKGKFIMGNKIFSAKMSGEEIQRLENQSQIEAIEPDMQMGIM